LYLHKRYSVRYSVAADKALSVALFCRLMFNFYCSSDPFILQMFEIQTQ